MSSRVLTYSGLVLTATASGGVALAGYGLLAGVLFALACGGGLAALLAQRFARRHRRAWTCDDGPDFGGYPLDMLRDGGFFSHRRNVA